MAYIRDHKGGFMVSADVFDEHGFNVKKRLIWGYDVIKYLRVGDRIGVLTTRMSWHLVT